MSKHTIILFSLSRFHYMLSLKGFVKGLSPPPPPFFKQPVGTLGELKHIYGAGFAFLTGKIHMAHGVIVCLKVNQFESNALY